MQWYHYALIIYFSVISLVAVCATVYDKAAAVHKRWRIRERTLLIISALGGSAAMYFTMLAIRHKTKHIKFMLGIPLIIILQALAAFFIITKGGFLF